MSTPSEQQIIDFLEAVDAGQITGQAPFARHLAVRPLVKSEDDANYGLEWSLTMTGIQRLARHRAGL